MFYFSKDDIIFIHSKLIADYGGSNGIRDEGMLESAINTPLQTFDGIDLYFFETDKIARLSYSLVMDHPFFDGNKRIAAAALDLGLSGNGLELNATVDELIDEFIRLASSKIEYKDFLNWVMELSLPKQVKVLKDKQRNSL